MFYALRKKTWDKKIIGVHSRKEIDYAFLIEISPFFSKGTVISHGEKTKRDAREREGDDETQERGKTKGY